MNSSAEKSSENLSPMSDEIRKADQVHPLNLDNCLYKEIYASVNQIFDPNYSLHNIDKAHCRALIILCQSYRYDYM